MNSDWYSEAKIAIVYLMAAMGVFAFDLSISLGVAGGVPYIVVVLLSLWSRKSRTTILCAVGCSALTVSGYFLSPDGGETWTVVFNRAIALSAIWVTAVLCLRFKGQFTQKVAISERLHESESCQKILGRILDKSRNEIYIFHAETLRFLHVNHGARENLGFTMEELRELTPLNLKPEFTAKMFSDIIEPLQNGTQQVLDFQTIHRRKDGSEYPVEVHLQLLEFETIPAFVAFILDITERKRQEMELKKDRDVAETANQSKSEFLANMSHEIRTPMAAILGFTDLIMDDEMSTSEILNAAGTIKKNGEFLIMLINDILDLSKVEAKQLIIEHLSCSPHSIVNGVVTLLKVRASIKGISLNVTFDGPIPESIYSDPTRLRQILTNIVGNAIKFTQTGSVRIETRLLEETCDEPKLQFDVIDMGIGIPEDSIDKLFAPFTQADSSTTRRFGGTGLGLAISKRLIELLGGEITVSSTEGTGSTFTITVPTGSLKNVRLLHSEGGYSSHAKSTKAADRTCLNNCRILLVEDLPDLQRLILLHLKRFGACVTIAENGQIAFEKAQAAMQARNPYHVILMDMQMPIMDGFEATRRLRDAGYLGPIIALTALAMLEDRHKCFDAGCDDYISKPIDMKKLIQSIQDFSSNEILETQQTS